MRRRIIDGLEANSEEIKKAIDRYDRGIVDFEHTMKLWFEALKKEASYAVHDRAIPGRD